MNENEQKRLNRGSSIFDNQPSINNQDIFGSQPSQNSNINNQLNTNMNNNLNQKNIFNDGSNINNQDIFGNQPSQNSNINNQLNTNMDNNLNQKNTFNNGNNINNQDIFENQPSQNSNINNQLNTNNIFGDNNLNTSNAENNNSNNEQSINNNLNNSTVVNNTDTTTSNINNNHPKNKKWIPILVGIILILILIVGFIFYKTISSKNIFKVIIDNSFNYLENSFVEYESAKGTFSLKASGNSKDTSTNKAFELINKIDLSGSYGIDYENKIINLDIKSNYDSQKLVNANIYMESGNSYIYLEDIYDKYIKVPINDYDSLFTNMDKKEDYKIVLNSVHNAINNSLKDEYFTKKKVTVDGKKVNKNTLKLNKNTYTTIKKDIVNSLLNDNKFLDSYSKISDQDVNEIKENLNDVLVEDDDFEEMDLSIYTKGINFEFVRFEISNASNQIVISSNDDIYNFEYFEDEQVIYDGSIKVDIGSNDVTYNISLNDKEENISTDFTIKNSVEYNKKVTKKDVSNSVNLDDITNKEMNEIYFKILGSDGISKLIQDIQGSDFDSNYSIVG